MIHSIYNSKEPNSKGFKLIKQHKRFILGILSTLLAKTHQIRSVL